MKPAALLIFLLLLCLYSAGCAGQSVAAAAGKPRPEQPVAAALKPAAQPGPAATLRAQALLATMTRAEKVGQMFFARCPGTGALDALSRYHLGGYILFATHFEQETPQSCAAMIRAWQQHAAIPLWVGTDEEGGIVTRVSQFPQYGAARFAAPQTLDAAGGLEAVARDAAEKSAFLLALGVNVNFAPVADISLSADDYIHARSFGKDAAATADYVETVINEMNAAGISGVLKHFPGYGANGDSHSSVIRDTRPLEAFYSADLLPFARGIAAGADFVLVSHNIVTALDPSLPASLSPAAHSLLRNELGFDGLIITDDLAMAGANGAEDAGETAVLAVLAGNDMLLSTDYPAQIAAVLAAVETGRIDEALIDAAVLRILRYKIMAGLFGQAA